MRLATASVFNIITSKLHNLSSNSMSQDYHQNGGVFSFSNGFETSHQGQIRRDKLRVSGYDPPPEEESGDALPVYESAGMLSEMFNFPPSNATELLENQILQGYRNSNWLQDSKNQISGMNAESAAAMQLYLMNPQQHHQASPSPSPSRPPSTLHMLLPNPSPSSSSPALLPTPPPTQFDQFPTWVPNTGNESNEIPGGVVEGQGLSLSLSSSLQQLDVAAKAEELRIGDAGMLFFGQGPAAQFQFKNFTGSAVPNQFPPPGIGSSYGTVNLIRNSKYAKAAQELLEEFCCVGRGQMRKLTSGNPNSNSGGTATSTTDVPPLSAGDRIEHQRRKVKLLSMLDEVDRRYNHYCDQMQTVVNSFDMVMGLGAAVPYTSSAQKAMSRHFRCLKDAITTQLKHSCDLLGEKDAGGTSGVTKGETPRLRILDQSLRQQRAFNQMGMMEQEVWRPQRGLPERSVNILRAWLFENFLHPYPSDADKHLLARQTGLSRNQVSNWFINARVRLWKPMVEEMYQQEANEDSDDTKQTPVPTDPTPTAAITSPPPPRIIALEDSSAVSIPATAEHESDVAAMESTVFGATSGDVSLTLGLRHAGNLLPEKGSFPVRDFGGF